MNTTPTDEAGHGDRLLALTAQIVAAHVANNAVQTDALPELIRSVHQTLTTIDAPPPPPVAAPTPAVPIRKSVFPDYIVCLEDGKQLTMLKRHLRSAYNMTPEQYRTRWGLPADYPMVAPNYAARRSELARAIGLGRKAEPVPPPSRGKRRGRVHGGDD